MLNKFCPGASYCSHVHNFWIIFKRDKGMYCPKISDEFDYGSSVSLMHWGRDNMAAKFLTTISDVFFWKTYENI